MEGKERKCFHEYGKRWKVEIYFPDMTRDLGKIIKARRTDYMIQEVGLKVIYYNKRKEITGAYR